MPFVDLDDDRAQDDEALHALIGVRCTENASALSEDRHMGAATAWVDPLTVSTHPDHWWGIPLIIPSEPGAERVRCVLTCEAVNADVSLALEADGAIGATVAVTAGAGIQVIEIEVTLPGVLAVGQDILGAIRIRSERGPFVLQASAESHIEHTIDVKTAPLGLPNTYITTHYVGEYLAGFGNFDTPTDDLPRFYIGAGRNQSASHAELEVWPKAAGMYVSHTNPGALDIYKLGELTIHGYAWSIEGARSVGVPPVALSYAGRLARGATPPQISEALRRVYRSRPHCALTQPLSIYAGRWAGYDEAIASGLTLCEAVIELREDVDAWQVSVLVARKFATSVDLDLEVLDVAGAVVLSRSGGATLTLGAGSSYGRDDANLADGVLATFGAPRRQIDAWGAGDLSYLGDERSDLERLDLITGAVNLVGAGLVVGSFYRVRIRLDPSALLRPAHRGIYAVGGLIREVIEVP
jgi:hypothetical protein